MKKVFDQYCSLEMVKTIVFRNSINHIPTVETLGYVGAFAQTLFGREKNLAETRKGRPIQAALSGKLVFSELTENQFLANFNVVGFQVV